MKKVISALLLVALCTTFSYAQDKPVTGNELLKVGKKARIQLVADFMQDMRKQGVTILKDATFYCKKLDRLYERKPNLLGDPIWRVLKTAMIMEHDWNVKGQNADAVAKDWLGEKLYNRWKEKHAKK